MKKIVAKKLQLRKSTLALLSGGDLAKAAGAAFTDGEDCVDTVPRSFCVCPTKHVCTINC